MHREYAASRLKTTSRHGPFPTVVDARQLQTPFWIFTQIVWPGWQFAGVGNKLYNRVFQNNTFSTTTKISAWYEVLDCLRNTIWKKQQNIWSIQPVHNCSQKKRGGRKCRRDIFCQHSCSQQCWGSQSNVTGFCHVAPTKGQALPSVSSVTLPT